ncbi:MAG: LysE family translocator [Spirochaetia bacterium]|nr:LysE family translocator [Spirochaetia bacterium]
MEVLLLFLSGFIIGVLISAPVGPINLAIVTTTAKHGAKFGFFIGLGAALMDVIYMLLALMGFTALNINPEYIFIVEILGILFIFYIGIQEFFYSEKKLKEAEKNLKKNAKKRKYFLMGIIFYLSNPSLIALFAGLGGWIKSQHFFGDTHLNNVLLSFFTGAGSIIWFGFFSLSIKKARAKITTALLTRISHISGILLICFSLYLIYRFVVKHIS